MNDSGYLSAVAERMKWHMEHSKASTVERVDYHNPECSVIVIRNDTKVQQLEIIETTFSLRCHNTNWLNDMPIYWLENPVFGIVAPVASKLYVQSTASGIQARTGTRPYVLTYDSMGHVDLNEK